MTAFRDALRHPGGLVGPVRSLTFNALLIAAMTGCVLSTGNPMFFLGLLALRDLPYGLAQAKLELDAGVDEENDGKPIGFTAAVK